MCYLNYVFNFFFVFFLSTLSSCFLKSSPLQAKDEDYFLQLGLDKIKNFSRINVIFDKNYIRLRNIEVTLDETSTKKKSRQTKEEREEFQDLKQFPPYIHYQNKKFILSSPNARKSLLSHQSHWDDYVYFAASAKNNEALKSSLDKSFLKGLSQKVTAYGNVDLFLHQNDHELYESAFIRMTSNFQYAEQSANNKTPGNIGFVLFIDPQSPPIPILDINALAKYSNNSSIEVANQNKYEVVSHLILPNVNIAGALIVSPVLKGESTLFINPFYKNIEKFLKFISMYNQLKSINQVEILDKLHTSTKIPEVKQLQLVQKTPPKTNYFKNFYTEYISPQINLTNGVIIVAFLTAYNLYNSKRCSNHN